VRWTSHRLWSEPGNTPVRRHQFLPTEYRSSTEPNELGDTEGEIRAFIAAGMDGFFTDHPDRGADAVP
jgi:glycerophosphoryl diester phosphodiesterase